MLGRSDRIALSVVALLLLSITGVALASALAEGYGGDKIAQHGYQEAAAQNQNGEPEPVHLGLFRPADTYAQWLMTVVSLVAAGISWRAVSLVHEQLVETRNAILLTRELGHMQTRAWLGLIDWKMDMNGDMKTGIVEHFVLQPAWRNTGQSPAFDVTIVNGDAADEKFRDGNPFLIVTHERSSIFPPGNVDFFAGRFAFTPEEMFAMGDVPRRIKSYARYRTITSQDFCYSRMEMELRFMGRQSLEELRNGIFNRVNLSVSILADGTEGKSMS